MHEAPQAIPEQPQDPTAARHQASDSIITFVIQQAAATIEAVGRELATQSARSTREFLRGPAMQVGVAISVLAATLWLQELIERHQAHARKPAVQAGRPRSARRRRSPPALR
jgi:hypothetical protein